FDDRFSGGFSGARCVLGRFVSRRGRLGGLGLVIGGNVLDGLAFGGLGIVGALGLVLDFLDGFDLHAGVEVRLFVAEQSAGGLGGAAGELFVLVGQLGFAVQPEHLGVGGHEADQSAA